MHATRTKTSTVYGRRASVKRPSVAACTVAALSAVSAAALVAAIAWTTTATPSAETPYDSQLRSAENQTISMIPEFIIKKNSSIHSQDVGIKYDQEYVKPIKSITGSLHTHDILYGGDQNILNRENLVKHHSGQYRHKTASVWDPHPEYEFTAFGQPFHLMLVHDSKFVSPELKVTHIEQNSSWREPPNVKVDGCFYSGNVSSEPGSVVTVSLCDGITGHIRTATGDYFIEPVETAGDHVTPALHAIYRARPPTVREPQSPEQTRPAAGQPEQNCGVQDNENSNDTAADTVEHSTEADNNRVNRKTENNEDRASAGIPFAPKSRKKRSLSSENVIELMIVADEKMADYHGDELHNYILTLMSIVMILYIINL